MPASHGSSPVSSHGSSPVNVHEHGSASSADEPGSPSSADEPGRPTSVDETSAPTTPTEVAPVAPFTPTPSIASSVPTVTLAAGGAISDETESPQESMQKIELSPFVLQFNVSGGTDSSTEDQRAALVSLTDLFLSDYFALLFGDPQSGATLDFFMVGSNGTPLVGDESISLEFKGVALFNPGLMPTVSEMDILLKEAFEADNTHGYMKELNKLPRSNVFSSTTVVIFNPAGSQSELEGAEAGDQTQTDGQESNEDSSKMSVGAIVATVVGGVLLLVAFAFVLYRRRAGSSEEKETGSVTSAEDHNLVEIDLGPPIPEDDNDYSVSSSASVKRAGYVFKGAQVFEDDDDTSIRSSRRQQQVPSWGGN
jgi:hypothetical protein